MYLAENCWCNSIVASLMVNKWIINEKNAKEVLGIFMGYLSREHNKIPIYIVGSAVYVVLFIKIW